jgi:RNA polymerase sigma factor for flagellar operon FliA
MQTETPRRRWIESDDAEQLWREYRDTDDPRLRTRLIMTYAPLVKYLAYRKIRELPPTCQIEDFISCGLEALIGAIDRYDPVKGATLEQYAWTRIHGAILDELRRQDWAPRSVRRWERDMETARNNFAGVQGRPPSREELADLLGVSTSELREREHRIATSDLTSLNAMIPGDDNAGVERVDTLQSSDRTADPEQVTSLTEAKDRFRRAFARLPKRQREIAVLLYVNELTLREVGEVLGVTESRVCQIHAELKRTLRATLSDDEALFRDVA